MWVEVPGSRWPSLRAAGRSFLPDSTTLDTGFLFLPELVESLSPEILSYLFPGQSDSIHVTDLYNRIRYEAKLVDVEGFLYRKFGQAYFYPINFSPEEGIPAILDDFISIIQANRIDDLYPGSEPNLLDESESITGEKASVKHQKRRIAKFRRIILLDKLFTLLITSFPITSYSVRL